MKHLFGIKQIHLTLQPELKKSSQTHGLIYEHCDEICFPKSNTDQHTQSVTATTCAWCDPPRSGRFRGPQGPHWRFCPLPGNKCIRCMALGRHHKRNPAGTSMNGIKAPRTSSADTLPCHGNVQPGNTAVTLVDHQSIAVHAELERTVSVSESTSIVHHVRVKVRVVVRKEFVAARLKHTGSEGRNVKPIVQHVPLVRAACNILTAQRLSSP